MKEMFIGPNRCLMVHVKRKNVHKKQGYRNHCTYWTKEGNRLQCRV